MLVDATMQYLSKNGFPIENLPMAFGIPPLFGQ